MSKQPYINLRGQHPVQNHDRAVFCQNLREIGVEKISALGSDYNHFIVQYLDDKDNVTSEEIDWEFALFQATPHQFIKLFKNFEVFKPKPKK